MFTRRGIIKRETLQASHPAYFSNATVTGLSVTILGAFFLFLVAPWFLLLFGPSYSNEGTPLLRWLSAAAPFVVLVGFYFSNLRFQKRITRLVVLSGVVAGFTLLFAVLFTSSIGIAAFGVGWFVGYLLGFTSPFRVLSIIRS